MNALKENPFIAAVIVIVVIGCGVLAFFANGAMTTYQETMAAYTQAVQKLQGLQNKIPFPNEANIKSAEALRDGYQARLAGLKSQLGTLQVPKEEGVSPQQFQDTLRSTVNAVVSRADAAKVELPEGFYLGFNEYKDNLPSEKAAPELARQLTIITRIIEDFIGPNPENPGVKSIDSLERTPLRVESGAATPPAGATKEEPKAALEVQPFVVAFTAEQGKFRIALNNLLKNPQFLIIRSLAITNSKTEGPPVAAAADAPASPSLFESTGSPSAEATSLNVLLGREVLQVKAALEIIHFPVPASAPAGTPPANPPAAP
ncbi:MAG: Amuc_1100 family pilus-like protein [Terrimicrobiaceae bacterium]